MGNACTHLPHSLRSFNSKDSTSSNSSRMESLPPELLMNILSWVPALDLMQLSSVCRRWRDILEDPLFRQLHYTHSLSNPNENQVLVLKTELKLHVVDLAMKKSKTPRHIPIDLPRVPSIETYSFVGSCNGLLCLGSTMCSRIIITNPVTPQHVLFSVQLKVWVIAWGFGFDESSKLFKVIVMAPCPYGRKLAVSVCDLGSNGSTDCRSVGETPYNVSGLTVPEARWDARFGGNKTPACFVNGRLHWVYYDAFSILSFDLTDEEVRRISAPNGLVDRLDSYLISFRGCLGIVHFRPFQTRNLQIWAMKEYGLEASWVKEVNTRPLLPRTLDVDFFWRFARVLSPVKDSEIVLLDKLGREPAIVFSPNSTCSKFKRLKLKEISTFWQDLIVWV